MKTEYKEALSDEELPYVYGEIAGIDFQDDEEADGDISDKKRAFHDFSSKSTEIARRTDKKKHAIVLLLLFLIFGVPLAGSLISAGFSLVTAVFGAVIGIFGGLIGLVIGGYALAIALAAGGIGLIVSGCTNMAQISFGIMTIGGGFFLLAGAMLMMLLANWGFSSVVPGVFRFGIGMIRKGFIWIRNKIRRISGRGGSAG